MEVETREEGYPVYGIHCNWGWSGSGDCWTSTKVFKPTGSDKDYSKNNRMVAGIRPL